MPIELHPRSAAVVLQPLCVVSNFHDLNGDPYPGASVDSGDFIACGPPAGTEIEFEAPGKVTLCNQKMGPSTALRFRL